MARKGARRGARRDQNSDAPAAFPEQCENSDTEVRRPDIDKTSDTEVRPTGEETPKADNADELSAKAEVPLRTDERGFGNETFPGREKTLLAKMEKSLKGRDLLG